MLHISINFKRTFNALMSNKDCINNQKMCCAKRNVLMTISVVKILYIFKRDTKIYFNTQL